jgi:transcriptional regulator with PAS, ATPase and Fis domain
MVSMKLRRGTAKYCFEDIITVSNLMEKAVIKAKSASRTASPIIIYGETGTGKELFVQSIHNNSPRSGRVFIAQNCAAIPAGLLESIIFGTIRGSFTGAENRKGLFELADGGTLYLDELNSMPLELQSKLLRVIQDGKVRRVGDTELIDVDVRIIASLNEEPELVVNGGRLRRDLYYRLNVVRIDVPPLRDRRQDIAVLVNYFINKFNKTFKSEIRGIQKDAMDILLAREWQGNVRELEHIIESIFNLKSEGIITTEDLAYTGANAQENRIIPLREKLAQFEERYIREALSLSGYNISRAARLLDIPRQTLQSKISRYNIVIQNRE